MARRMLNFLLPTALCARMNVCCHPLLSEAVAVLQNTQEGLPSAQADLAQGSGLWPTFGFQIQMWLMVCMTRVLCS
jgi:hypothetical protein